MCDYAISAAKLNDRIGERVAAEKVFSAPPARGGGSSQR